MQNFYMTYEERKRFETLYNGGATPKELAKTFSRNVATVYGELKRGACGETEDFRRKYSAEVAQKNFVAGLARRGRRKVNT